MNRYTAKLAEEFTTANPSNYVYWVFIADADGCILLTDQGEFWGGESIDEEGYFTFKNPESSNTVRFKPSAELLSIELTEAEIEEDIWNIY